MKQAKAQYRPPKTGATGGLGTKTATKQSPIPYKNNRSTANVGGKKGK